MGVAGMSAMPPGGADEAARGMSDRAGLSGSHVGYGVPGYDPRMGPPRSGYAPGAHQMAPPPVVRPDLYQHEPGRPFPPDFPGWDRRFAADPQRGAFRDGFFSSQPLMEPQMTRLHREDAGARRGREGNGNRFGALQPRRP
ncbi:hypothetical protein H632_c557p0 [Helicosporidium sp. ATCC 50920]|nr:hypothetical protein H632_c557p0 [Helicosporidium sp. ATCC 50920]|eukprot:KDD75674.1 hypothetical protein H632_c557p0 [Helicosporidium sp. ATCC 50920]